MQNLKEELLNSLLQLKSIGKFASIHSEDFVFPRLAIEELGEIAFPINS